MAGKVLAVQAAPHRRVDTATGSFVIVGQPGSGPPTGPSPAPRLASALASAAGAAELPPAEQDDAWNRTIARREADAAAGWAAEGIIPPEPPMRVAGGIQPTPVQRSFAPVFRDAPPTADLTGLPDRFTLEIGQKPDGWWVITAPAHHVGLFVAGQDLLETLTSAPGALAQILRLDGAQPKTVKRARRRLDKPSHDC